MNTKLLLYMLILRARSRAMDAYSARIMHIVQHLVADGVIHADNTQRAYDSLTKAIRQ
jgi:hypothetical protein